MLAIEGKALSVFIEELSQGAKFRKDALPPTNADVQAVDLFGAVVALLEILSQDLDCFGFLLQDLQEPQVLRRGRALRILLSLPPCIKRNTHSLLRASPPN